MPRSLAEISHVGRAPTWSKMGPALSQRQSACGARGNGRPVLLQTGFFQCLQVPAQLSRISPTAQGDPGTATLMALEKQWEGVCQAL